MNFTAIFCCYILLPYFASLVSPPQQAITCNAVAPIMRRIKNDMKKLVNSKHNDIEKKSSEKVNEDNTTNEKNTEKYEEKANKDDRYFQQKLDHYHFNDVTKWQQRYMVNGEHYKGNGIIFIMLGDDMDITSKHMQTGGVMEYVKHVKALYVGIELRSYSKKFPKRKEPNDSLKYFNTEQTLADVAWFVYNIRNEINKEFELPEKLKWVAYGTGLQGSLATWFRMKFPHLMHMTLAVGARLLAIEKYDGFFYCFNRDMVAEESELWKKINEAYKQIKMILDTYYQPYRTEQDEKKENPMLGKLFKFCNVELLADVKNRKKNLEFMFITFAKAVAIVIQFGNKNDYMESIKKKVTEIMLGGGEDEKLSLTERLILIVMMVARKSESECLQIDYLQAVSVYKSTKNQLYFPLTEIFGNRASLFQKCTEYGQFQLIFSYFGITVDLDYYTEFCNTVFGELSTKEILKRGVRKTNVFYGGLDIKVSQVVFVYGSRDPYRGLSVSRVKTVKNSVVLPLIGSWNPNELQCYPTARDKIRSYLKTWLELSEDIGYTETEKINKINGSDTDSTYHHNNCS